MINWMERIRGWISSEGFRVYLSTDLVGVELGGALMNVIAYRYSASHKALIPTTVSPLSRFMP